MFIIAVIIIVTIIVAIITMLNRLSQLLPLDMNTELTYVPAEAISEQNLLSNISPVCYLSLFTLRGAHGSAIEKKKNHELLFKKKRIRF